MQKYKNKLYNIGIETGASGGATLWLAKQISNFENDTIEIQKKNRKHKKIVAICADGK